MFVMDLWLFVYFPVFLGPKSMSIQEIPKESQAKRALARFKDLNEHLKDKFGSPRQWKLWRVSVGVYLAALCG